MTKDRDELSRRAAEVAELAIRNIRKEHAGYSGAMLAESVWSRWRECVDVAARSAFGDLFVAAAGVSPGTDLRSHLVIGRDAVPSEAPKIGMSIDDAGRPHPITDESIAETIRIRRTAIEIVDAIIHDLRDRRGLKHEWYAIDEDVRDEIRNKWLKIVESGSP